MIDLTVEPKSLITGDFNGDGRDDLAVAQWEIDYPTFNDRISVLLGDGSGSFAPALDIDGPDAMSPNELVAADFNGDGKTDLASANRGTFDVSILTNIGHCYVNCSTFSAASPHATSSAPQATAFGDFNRDGRIDLVAASPGSNKLDVFLATALGTFSPAISYDAGTGPATVAAGDFNGDGVLDLAAAGTATEYVAVLLGNAAGGFSSATTYYAANTMTRIIPGDYDGDGILDLAASGWGSGGIVVLTGNGSGGFPARASYTAGSLSQSIAAGDLDRDGFTDLVVASLDGLWIRRGTSDGQFLNGGRLDAGTTPVSVAVGDLNGDGALDLIAASSGSETVSIIIATSPGVFASAVNYAIGSTPTSLVVGDFDRDGDADVVVSNGSTSGASILRGLGNGTFSAAANLNTGSAASHVATADFDRDGKLDLAVASAGSSSASILLNSCPAPDLTVVKSHDGSFTQGQSARLYSIVVSNVALTATAGVVTVVDALPTGLTAVEIGGPGWTCTLATLTCTRSDVLNGNSSYPAIGLLVNVDLNAPAVVTNVATVSGGGQVNYANDTSSDPADVAGYQDLSLTKTHAGNFHQGQNGATYVVVVSNVGRMSTAGTVTMTDTLPAGLTATGISGTGWTCSLAPLRCTRSDVLAAGASYPQITVTVNVAADAAASVTNTAAVSGGGQLYTGNDSVTDPTTVLPPLLAPTNLVATAVSSSAINITWTSVSGAAGYRLFRKSEGQSFAYIGAVDVSLFVDSAPESGKAYVYRAIAINGTAFSPVSNSDVATMSFFTDDPLVAGSTIVKGVHLTELRAAVQAVRTAAGLASVTLTDPAPGGLPIRAVHVTELRSALDEARNALGLVSISYEDPSIDGLTIKAAHIRDVRNGVK